jgi:hypothetical protein
MHAGHFRRRGKSATRYNELNASAQCPGCNTYRGGMEYEHGRAIDLKFGEGTAEHLHELSQGEHRLKKFELEEIAADYKAQAIEMARRKGIET